MEPRNRHELEAWGCVALFILVILALASWSLYEHGYLGIAIAVIGGVALSVGLIRTFRVRLARRDRVNQRRSQREKEQQTRLPWEQERQLDYEERSVHSVPQEGRDEEEQLTEPLREEEQPVELSKRAMIVQRLNEMSEREFEQLVTYYLRNQGYDIDTVLASDSRGADLIISAAEGRISVLLKRQDTSVSNRAVQEALGGRAFYGTYEAWLITNNTFTRETRYEARRKDVRLTDRDELAEWLDKLSDSPEELRP